ncbi:MULTISPECIES: hypothetical protein [unclassified Microcoleus]|uniref:hypothetical protein n=1 Tax=unclassified Microcoleus TaxID=2642155 RepID=UPI002FD0A082
MKKTPSNEVLVGDCREVMKTLPENYISACITDPPYNYEFIGHKWDDSEIQRRIEKVNGKGNKTLVKNIPYGSGLYQFSKIMLQYLVPIEYNPIP